MLEEVGFFLYNLHYTVLQAIIILVFTRRDRPLFDMSIDLRSEKNGFLEV